MKFKASELSDLKREAKRQLGSVDGVQGFGVGDQRLLAYVRNRESALKLPTSFQGVELETVVTGDVSSQVSDLKI